MLQLCLYCKMEAVSVPGLRAAAPVARHERLRPQQEPCSTSGVRLEDTSTHPGSGQNIQCLLRFPAFQQKWVVRAVAPGCGLNSAPIPHLKRGQMLKSCRGVQCTQTSWWPGNCQLWVQILVTFYKAPFPFLKVSKRTYTLKGIQNKAAEVPNAATGAFQKKSTFVSPWFSLHIYKK